MRSERPSFREVVRKTALFITLWVLVQPMFNPDTVGLVIDAAMGKTPDCSSGKPSNTEGYPYDLIIVPGGGVYEDGDGVYKPNTYQRARLDAAAYAYVGGYAQDILLSGGDPDLGVDMNLSKNYLQGRVLIYSDGEKSLDDSHVVIEDESINTATGMAKVPKIMDELGAEKALVVSHKSHINRAEIMACNYGVNAKSMSVEGIVESHNYYIAQNMNTNHGSDDSGWWIELKESLEVGALPFDRYAFGPTLIKIAQNKIDSMQLVEQGKEVLP